MLNFTIATTALSIIYIPPIFLLYLVTYQLAYYDYKITDKEIELINWQKSAIFTQFISTIVVWIFIIGCTIAFIAQPSALFAGLGGGAAMITLASGRKVLSKKYLEDNLEYAHIRTEWGKIASSIYIDKQRKLVLFGGENLNDEKKQSKRFFVFYKADEQKN